MHHNPYQSFWKKFFNSKAVLVLFLVLASLVVYSIFREKKSQQHIVASINSLEQEISQMEDKNLELAEMIKYLKSNQFIEHEAREKLNLTKPGEKLVIVPEAINQVAGDSTDKFSDMPNYLQWWYYFFD